MVAPVVATVIVLVPDPAHTAAGVTGCVLIVGVFWVEVSVFVSVVPVTRPLIIPVPPVLVMSPVLAVFIALISILLILNLSPLFATVGQV